MSHSFLLLQGLEDEILYALGVVLIWIIAALLIDFFVLWLLGKGYVSSQQGDDPRQKRQ